MNHYAIGHLVDKGGRHYWLSENLKKDRYEPVVFGCNEKHNSKGSYFSDDKLWQEQYSDSGVKYVPIRSTQYDGNGLDRIKNMFVFAWNLVKTGEEYAKKNGRPDIICASSVHPLTILAGEYLAHKFNVPCISEVRDLWPETLVVYDAIKKDTLFSKLLYQCEKMMYKNADAIVFTMEGAIDYIKEKKWDKESGGPIDLSKVFYVCNGVDLEQFDYNADNYIIPDAELDNPNLFCATYTGAIKQANNLEILIEVAKHLKNIDNFRILIWGEGNEVKLLREKIHKYELDGRVILKGFVEKKYIPSILKRSDVSLMHWAQTKILNYGYSFNKLFEYLAAGSVVFCTTKSKHSLLTSEKCAIEAQGHTPEDFANDLKIIYKLTLGEKNEFRRRARIVAEKYDFKVLTRKFEQIIEGV